MSHRDSMLYKIYLGVSINTWSGSFGLKRYQAQALGIADRNVGKVSGRAEFYQRLKALSVVPVKEPTKGQAVIVGVPMPGSVLRIPAIKALCELTPGHGLKEAKDVADMFGEIKSGVLQDEANKIAKLINEAGGSVEILTLTPPG